MKLVKRLNLMNNKKLIFWLSLCSIPLTFLFILVFTAIAYWIDGFLSAGLLPLSLLISFLAYLVLIVVHELIHGLFFKLFHPAGKVKFGFKNGMAYATSPQSRYSRVQFTWISLAPFLIITLSLFVLFLIDALSALNFIIIASFHGASCIGDFFWVYLIIRTPRGSLIEDTEQGMNIYGNSEGDTTD